MFTRITVILNRRGQQQDFEMPSVTTVGYAAFRVAESRGLDSETTPCCLADPTTGQPLDSSLTVADLKGPVLFLLGRKPS